MNKNFLSALFNFLLLFGMGIYLTFYIFQNEVELKSGLTIIAGTLMGYGFYSTLIYLKITKKR